MNIKNIGQRSLGLLLLLILMVVERVVLLLVPIDALLAYTVVTTALGAVAYVVAGYFLRTYWALLIVPVVSGAGGYVLAFLISYPVSIDRTPENFFQGAVFLIANEGIIITVSSIVTALLALLGVLLGKRSARRGAALAAA